MSANGGRLVAILQARMSSSRLPGKVLTPVLGKPMIALQVERLRRARHLDAIWVATSTEASDDAIADVCKSLDVAVYRGSLADVLDRYAGAARRSEATAVMRLTADCPLADPAVIDGLASFFAAGAYDYASNTLDRTWPRGLDAEVMTADALETAAHEAIDPYEREHVTPYIYRRPDRFRLGAFTGPEDNSDMRLTVDYTEDLRLIRRIYEALYADNPEFTTADIVAFLEEHPEVRALNAAIAQA
jgi:spore coat polysaccharide biosynthesis protein SpsF